MPETGIIILAAGASRRMGQPKQLLKIDENSLIQHVIKIAQRTFNSPIVVVLGSNFELIKKEIENFAVTSVFNQDWENGMGTSIAKGVETIQNLNPKLRAVIILLVDQPFVNESLLNKLQNLFHKTDKKIITSKYKETFGVPALFGHSVFLELKALKGHEGAKKVIQKYIEKEQVAFVDFREGGFDLDTQSDYERFLKKINKK